MASSLIGKTLANRYKVEAFIDRGGMAEVYKVLDKQRNTHLAMKLLYESLAVDRVFIRRFRREAQTLSKLKHPHIVRFYGLEQEGHLAFMLLDYIRGKTLKRVMFDAGGPMPLDEVGTIMQAICTALQYAHTQGLIHCDMKPGNVMVNHNGNVLVTDFGIARMMDAATATMVGMGTPAYMAPEQARGLDPVPQTDIYALGVLLFEMLTGGERPFTGDRAQATGSTSEKVRWEQVNLKPPSPRAYNPELSPRLEAIIMKCLAKDPQDRFATPLTLLHALETVLHELGVAIAEQVTITADEMPASEAPTQLEPAAPVRRQAAAAEPQPKSEPVTKRPWFWPVVGAGLAVLALFFLIGGGDEPASPVVEEPAVAEASEPTEESDPAPATSESEDQPTYTPLPTYTSQPTFTSAPPTETDEPTETPDPTDTPNPTDTPEPEDPEFTANENMFCRDGPGLEYEDHTMVMAGETVPVYAKWSNNWLLVGIDKSNTRTKCCWVGGSGNLNVNSSSLDTINFLVDRKTCQKK